MEKGLSEYTIRQPHFVRLSQWQRKEEVMEPWKVIDIVNAVGGTLLCGEEEDYITSVSINSKEIEKGALFVPLIGERVDAHTFIGMAVRAGARAVFTSRDMAKEEPAYGASYIRVADTLGALQKLGMVYREAYMGTNERYPKIPVIGITGSVGKTTTKEMIAAALEPKMPVLKTAGNMNSQVGLPVMMTRLEKYHQGAVIEMGMSEEGEMSRLAEIAKPELAVMTNIGISHIAQLGSRENIRKEKANIINAFPEGGILYLNGDDELLMELIKYQKDLKEGTAGEIPLSLATQEKLKSSVILTFGTKEGLDYRAEDIRTDGENTSFTYIGPNETAEITLSVLGKHNVGNALAALAVAEHFGIPAAEAGAGLKEYRPIAMRGQIHEKNGIKIVDDTYNASPDSMKSGIKVLLSMSGVHRRIAVLADARELGAESGNAHYGVGVYIARERSGDNRIDEVITIGGEAAAIAKGVNDNNTTIMTHSFDTTKDALEYLRKTAREGDAVLVKGSRGMHTDEIVRGFLNDNELKHT